MSSAPPDLSQFILSDGSDSMTQPASSATGDQGILSGLSDVFSAVGAGVASGIKASQSPKVPVAVGPAGAGVVYNPMTGQYTSVYGVAGQSTMMPLLLILGLGVVLYVAFRKG